jgi:hypothetical protein
MAKGQKKRKQTDANVKKLEEALKWWLTRESACAYAWFSRVTLWDWCKRDPDFLTFVEDCENYRLAIVEDAKRKQITSWYRPAIEKELKSKRRDVYGDKQEIDQTSKITHTINDDQIKAIESLKNFT